MNESMNDIYIYTHAQTHTQQLVRRCGAEKQNDVESINQGFF